MWGKTSHIKYNQKYLWYQEKNSKLYFPLWIQFPVEVQQTIYLWILILMCSIVHWIMITDNFLIGFHSVLHLCSLYSFISLEKLSFSLFCLLYVFRFYEWCTKNNCMLSFSLYILLLLRRHFKFWLYMYFHCFTFILWL